MPRPKAKDGIRARMRSYDGIIEVHFVEYPGHWIATPERDRDKAVKWAKRNRDRLIKQRNTNSFRVYCKGFFDPDGVWVERMRKKGHHYTEKYLANRQGYVDNYIIPEFGSLPGKQRTK
jgi:hypothetical protein